METDNLTILSVIYGYIWSCPIVKLQLILLPWSHLIVLDKNNVTDCIHLVTIQTNSDGSVLKINLINKKKKEKKRRYGVSSFCSFVCFCNPVFVMWLSIITTAPYYPGIAGTYPGIQFCTLWCPRYSPGYCPGLRGTFFL